LKEKLSKNKVKEKPVAEYAAGFFNLQILIGRKRLPWRCFVVIIKKTAIFQIAD